MHWIDPTHLPKTAGTLQTLLLNPHGDVDGFVFDDGLEVHVPPHVTRAHPDMFNKGVKLTVFGVRPRDVEMVCAVECVTSKGERALDEGPPHKPKGGDQGKAGKPKSKPGTEGDVEGVVRQLLHGPHGEVRGALLDDGSSVRFPPHAAEGLRKWLKRGAKLAAHGRRVTAHGASVLDASKLGPRPDALSAVPPPPGH